MQAIRAVLNSSRIEACKSDKTIYKRKARAVYPEGAWLLLLPVHSDNAVFFVYNRNIVYRITAHLGANCTLNPYAKCAKL